MSTGLEIYLKAYQDLQYDRPIGMDVGFIPWLSIVNWCKIYKITCAEKIDVFVKYLRAIEEKEYSLRKK